MFELGVSGGDPVMWLYVACVHTLAALNASIEMLGRFDGFLAAALASMPISDADCNRAAPIMDRLRARRPFPAAGTAPAPAPAPAVAAAAAAEAMVTAERVGV